MTGLDKIIAQIQQDARQSANETLNAAKSEAAQIAAEGKTAAESAAQSVRDKAKTQAANARSAAESAAALSKRQAILAAKQEIIADVIEQAKEDMRRLDSTQYFAFILKMVEKYSTGEKGTLLFSPDDLSRMPAFFQMKVADVSKDCLTVSTSETRPIDGGFVLAYEGIEENCSVSALFDAASERLQDTVSKFLFS